MDCGERECDPAPGVGGAGNVDEATEGAGEGDEDGREGSEEGSGEMRSWSVESAFLSSVLPKDPEADPPAAAAAAAACF